MTTPCATCSLPTRSVGVPESADLTSAPLWGARGGWSVRGRAWLDPHGAAWWVGGGVRHLEHPPPRDLLPQNLRVPFSTSRVGVGNQPVKWEEHQAGWGRPRAQRAVFTGEVPEPGQGWVGAGRPWAL